MEKKTENITLRCPPSLKQRVRMLAEVSHRSVSRQVIYLLELGIESLERIGEDARVLRSHRAPDKIPMIDETEVVEEEGELAEW